MLPPQKGYEFPVDGEICQTKIFKEIYEFSEGWGGGV